MTEYVKKQIDTILGRLSLQEKIGQCLTLNHSGASITSYEKKYVAEFFCGGLRMTPHIIANVSENSDSFRYRKLAPYATPIEYGRVTRQLQEMALERNGIPLHLVTDQEGDLSIDILRGGMNLFPSSMGIAATSNLELAYEAALAIGKQLRAQGINWMHSPVVDVNVQPSNPEIGMRSFSDDPQICADFGIAMMKGFLAAGVMPTAKHFPGRGDSLTDAHDSLDVSDKSLEDLLATELLPYRKMIGDGTYFSIMTAHQAFTALDSDNIPASLSHKITTQLLREDMGFKGVITTDSIGMQGAIDYAGSIPDAVLQSLIAGADLVLLKTPEEVNRKSFDLIYDAVKSGTLKENEIDSKVQRILEAKFELDLFTENSLHNPDLAEAPIKDPIIIETCKKVFQQGAIITRDNESLIPLKEQSRILLVEQYIPLYHEKCNDLHYHPGMFSDYMREINPDKKFISLETDTPATKEDIKRFKIKLNEVDTVIFFNLFWRGSGSNRKLIRAAVEKEKKVIAATNDLYDSYYLPSVGTVLCSFGAVPIGLKTAAQIISGKIQPGGKWPLRRIAQSDTVPEDQVSDHFIAGHFSQR